TVSIGGCATGSRYANSAVVGTVAGSICCSTCYGYLRGLGYSKAHLFLTTSHIGNFNGISTRFKAAYVLGVLRAIVVEVMVTAPVSPRSMAAVVIVTTISTIVIIVIPIIPVGA